MTGRLTGHCHCRAFCITVPQPPPDIVQCNCSLCCATGFLGSYYDPAVVHIAGGDACDAYIWGDRCIAIWHCRTCGITTHWTPLDHAPSNRMGINIRLFAPEIWESLPIRPVDGRSF